MVRGSRGPVPGEDFPTNDDEFTSLFSTDEKCWNYIYEFGRPKADNKIQIETLWPWRLGKKAPFKTGLGQRGLHSVCRICGSDKKPYITSRGYIECRNRSCEQKPIMLTTGTIFHNRRRHLSDWFRAIWLILSDDGCISGKQLQRELSLGCYQTALQWRNVIRGVMARANSRLVFPSYSDIFVNLIELTDLDGIESDEYLGGFSLLIVLSDNKIKKKLRLKIIKNNAKNVVEEIENVYRAYNIKDNNVVTNQRGLIDYLQYFWGNLCWETTQDSKMFGQQEVVEKVSNLIDRLELRLRLVPHGYVKFFPPDLLSDECPLNSFLNEFSFRENYQYPKKYGAGSLFYHFMEEALMKPAM